MFRNPTETPKKSEQALESYLVIPLEKNSKPFIKQMLPKTEMANCIYTKISTLEMIQSNYTSPQIVDLQTLISQHNAISKKIEIKNMKEYGDGAFSKKMIEKNELLIYPGYIGLITEFDQADSQILSVTPDGIPESRRAGINPVNTPCIAKYLQHLPDATHSIDTEAVSANFISAAKFIHVKYKNKTLLVPVNVLIALENISAGSILGFCYGIDYWINMKISPAFFNRKGEALESYDMRCKDKDHHIFFPMTRLALENFVKYGFSITGDECNLLTAESRTILEAFLKNLSPKKGVTVIEIPSIVNIVTRGKMGKFEDGYGYYVVRKKDDVVSAEMEKIFKIALTDFKNIPMMVLPLTPITVASKDDLLKLIAYPIPFCKITLYQAAIPAKQMSPKLVSMMFKSADEKIAAATPKIKEATGKVDDAAAKFTQMSLT